MGLGVFKLIRRNWLRVLGPTVLVIASTVLAWRTDILAQSPPPIVPGVPDSVWARSYTRLDAPTEKPKVGQARIEQAALAQVPEATVRGTVLARIRSVYPTLTESVLATVGPNAMSVVYPPPMDQLVWIVSLTPPDGYRPPSGGPAPHSGRAQVTLPAPRYLVLIFDATTGEFVTGISGS